MRTGVGESAEQPASHDLVWQGHLVVLRIEIILQKVSGLELSCQYLSKEVTHLGSNNCDVKDPSSPVVGAKVESGRG